MSDWSKITDISKVYKSTPIDFHEALGVDKAIPLGNMSFCDIGGIDLGGGMREPEGNLLVSVRQFNYWIETDGVTRCSHMLGDFLGARAYHFAVTDRNFRFIRSLKCQYKNLYALEDMRLVRFGDVVQSSATNVMYGPVLYRIFQHDLLIRGIAGGSVMFTKPVVFPNVREKNYIPDASEKGAYITDICDGYILTAKGKRQYRKTRSRCEGAEKCSGSSQLFGWMRDGKDMRVALVHKRMDERYINAFAFFDRTLSSCRISRWFSVFGDRSPVNFTCGMSIDGDIATLPICVNDGETHLFRVPICDFFPG